jgi:hypothetical protein
MTPKMKKSKTISARYDRTWRSEEISTALEAVHPILNPSKNPTRKLPAKGRSEITPTNHEKAEPAEPIRPDNALNNEA